MIVSLCSISITARLCQNGPDACLKAVEFIDKINENVEQKIALICQYEDTITVVLVIDELNHQTH